MQGSPLAVRRAVGQAPEENRLDVLKQFYPKAKTAEEFFNLNPKIKETLGVSLDDVGKNNFFYLDNGKLEIFNKPGFFRSKFPFVDTGDIEESGRDVASGLGGIIGGSTAIIGGQLGPQVATPEEIYTVPAGAALGSEMGARAYDVLVDLTSGVNIPNRGFVNEVKRSATNIATEYGVGQMADVGIDAIRSIIKSGGQMVSGIKPSQIINDLNILGIDPTFGLLSNRRSIANIEEVLLGNPFAADTLIKQRNRLLNDIKNASERISTKYGVASKDSEEAGFLIQNAVQNARQKFKARQNTLYGAAYDAAGDVGTNLSSLKELKTNLQSQLDAAPTTLKGDIQPVINQINGIIKDSNANNGVLPLSVLRTIRTQIGKNLGPIKGKVRIAKEGDEYLSSIYSALTKDMNDAVKLADNPNALALLSKADRYTRMNNNLNVRKVFDEIDRRKLPSQVYDFATQGSDAGASRINSILRNLNGEERGALAATIFGKLGYKKNVSDDTAFSVATFLTNWKKLNPKAKQALFGAGKYREAANEINSLIRIMDVVDEAGKSENISRTATKLLNASTLNSLLIAGGAVTYGVFGGAGSQYALAGAGTLTTVALAPAAAAELITSPKFIRWLKGTTQAVTKNPNQLGVQLARLGVIAERDSDLAPAINEYLNNMAITLTLPKPEPEQNQQAN